MYEAQPANPKRDLPAVEPTWYLMNAGARWEVMPHQPGRDVDTLERQLMAWLDAHVFTPTTNGD